MVVLNVNSGYREKGMSKSRPQALIITGPGSLQKGLLALMTAIPRVNVIGEVADGLQALEVIRKHRPNLVLLDTNLPGDEGWRVLRQIRSQWPKIRCIVLADDVQQQRNAEALGADVVLLKGFPPAKLATTIEKLLP
jgi:DNA-binding NarL/FixJ family response regulator